LTQGTAKQDTAVLIGRDKKVDVYPQSPESLKQLSGSAKKINIYEMSRDKTMIKALKLSSNLSVIQYAWNVSFGEGEALLTYEESTAVNGPRDNLIKFGGKEFKKYDGIHTLLAAVTMAYGKDFLNLYLINAETGKVLTVLPIFSALPAKVPLVQVYDNVVIVGFHYGKGQNLKDKIYFAELCLSPEMAEASQSSDKQIKENIKEEDMILPLKAMLELNWEIYGLKLIRTENNKEFIVTIDEDQNIQLTDLSSIQRNKMESQEISKTMSISVPKDLNFRAPVSILYDHKSKRLIAHGLDILSVQFP
jgi:hypothetical protein